MARRTRRRFPAAPVVMGVGLGGLALALGVWLALRSPASATAPPLSSVAPAGRGARAGAAGQASGAGRGKAAGADEAGDDPAAGDPVVAPANGGGLTRADVVNGIASVRPNLGRCPRDKSLIGLVRLTVGSSGKVAAVQIHGALAGTAAGRCVADVAREASFPPSRREQTVIRWPIAIGHGRPGGADFAPAEPDVDDAPGPATLQSPTP